MSGFLRQKYFASEAAILTPTYRGPDRRDPLEPGHDEPIARRIPFGDKGNSTLDMSANLPRRRKDDQAIDRLKSRDPASPNLKPSED
jgi:hypothetical protein